MYYNRKKKLYLVVGVALLVVILAGYLKYKSDISSAVDSTSQTKVSFLIKKGETAKDIGKDLKDKGFIKSDFSFYWYIKLNSLGEKIVAGRFMLAKSMTTKEIAAHITNSKEAEFIITIQEGLRIKDIDQKLVDLELIKPSEFIDAVKKFDGWKYYTFLDKPTLEKLDLPLEGYIYPDTYFLSPSDFKASDLIYLALDNFENKFKDYQPQIKKHTVSEIVTMASIIENEVFGKENREIVSGILWKRLNSGWKLDTDATIIYVTGDRKITSADLQLDSPYNTRKFGGLPPGPICNPSIESILAAMFPKESDYWFYLTTLDTGEVIYAKSNDEQNVNKAKYLQ
ncbi:MAG: endolytic transglycosylase MltG [Candidatus Gracilibacteria bacterium]